MRTQFLLDPDVVFLNHGSFGACPIPVFDTYQRWQRELERQPVDFLGRRADGLLDQARAHLGAFLKTAPENLIFVPNATVGVNTVARSLSLQPGDEILTTNHEYGAMDYTWEFVCAKTGARYERRTIPVPLHSIDEMVERFWSGVTPRTRAIFISHITSPTALKFPLQEICKRAREAGVLTIIDGAHAPGQIPLDLTALDADFYTGNCHKWLCAPKGSGFLYVRREHQPMIEPLVISWGYVENSTFVSRNQWQGTRDVAAFLSVPAAIEFQQNHNWDAVRQRCHALASEARQRISDLFHLEPIQPDSPDWFAQMVVAPIPSCDTKTMQQRLYAEHRIEAPLYSWNGHTFVRVSFQGYNTSDDLERLIDALPVLLKDT